MVALVTILLNNEVSGEGPEGVEGLLSRGVWWGQKGKASLVCRVNIKSIKKNTKSIKRMRLGMPPHSGKPAPKISSSWALENMV